MDQKGDGMKCIFYERFCSTIEAGKLFFILALWKKNILMNIMQIGKRAMDSILEVFGCKNGRIKNIMPISRASFFS